VDKYRNPLVVTGEPIHISIQLILYLFVNLFQYGVSW